jgi:hypothetical protein
MMNGGRPIFTMPKPWNMPIARPISSVIEIAAQTGTPFSSNSAMITVEKPATAPTDRSMPAVMMTKVCPIARMAIIEPCRSRFVMLLAVAKFGVAIERMMQSSSRSPSSVSAKR